MAYLLLTSRKNVHYREKKRSSSFTFLLERMLMDLSYNSKTKRRTEVIMQHGSRAKSKHTWTTLFALARETGWPASPSHPFLPFAFSIQLKQDIYYNVMCLNLFIEYCSGSTTERIANLSLGETSVWSLESKIFTCRETGPMWGSVW